MKKYVFLLILLFLFIGCKNDRSNTVSLEPDEISFTKEGNLTITDSSGNLVTQLNIEIAETNYETETGLMYRESMEDNQGMLFIFSEIKERFFYMKNTNIPLDIIYIDEDKNIVTIAENAKPLNEESLPSQVPVKYVLEVNAGLSSRLSIQKGDKVSWVRN